MFLALIIKNILFLFLFLAQEPFNFSTISVINSENQNMYVDETITSATMSSTALSSTLTADLQSSIPKSSFVTVMDRLNVAEAKKAGPFLDGCNVSFLQIFRFFFFFFYFPKFLCENI